jgi:hypothetical protein
MERDGDPGEVEELSPSEAARARHRDRKRIVRMVVDNAGVKRILLARAARRAEARKGDRKKARGR